jgi:hypothetical protein
MAVLVPVVFILSELEDSILNPHLDMWSYPLAAPNHSDKFPSMEVMGLEWVCYPKHD